MGYTEIWRQDKQNGKEAAYVCMDRISWPKNLLENAVLLTLP